MPDQRGGGGVIWGGVLYICLYVERVEDLRNERWLLKIFSFGKKARRKKEKCKKKPVNNKNEGGLEESINPVPLKFLMGGNPRKDTKKHLFKEKICEGESGRGKSQESKKSKRGKKKSTGH